MWFSVKPADIGKQAEQSACRYLEKQNLQIITKNYRCRLGEIDIIARSAEHLVFVEVRYRSNSNFGSAAATVDIRKQRRIILTARHYLGSAAGGLHYRELPCRFDVIEACPDNSGKLAFNWLTNAFQE